MEISYQYESGQIIGRTSDERLVVCQGIDEELGLGFAALLNSQPELGKYLQGGFPPLTPSK